MRGRDITQERDIWAAPDGPPDGKSVCDGCPLAETCKLRGARRHIRVDRSDFPRIDWDHPQHLARERARYARRTGVERAIERLKVDLGGEHLTHRDALRVQAHFDKRLLLLHVLLAIEDAGWLPVGRSLTAYGSLTASAATGELRPKGQLRVSVGGIRPDCGCPCSGTPGRPPSLWRGSRSRGSRARHPSPWVTSVREDVRDRTLRIAGGALSQNKVIRMACV